MKKIVPFLSLFILLSAFTCENEALDEELIITNPDVTVDPNDPNNPNPQQGVFSVDFDGQTFVAESVSATVLDDVMNINGLRNNNNELVVLTINGSGTGTYQLGVSFGNPPLTNGAVYTEQNNTSGVSWISAVQGGTESQGEIIVTEIDDVNNTISGTFSFTGTNPTLMESKEFTNGVFTNITYTTDISTTNNNTFFAKVDGVEFEENLLEGTLTSLAGTEILTITATKNNLESIGFFLPADIATGTHTFSTFSQPSGQYNIGTTSSNVADGTITISNHNTTDKIIEGTFEFTAAPLTGGGQTYSITEGEFYIEY